MLLLSESGGIPTENSGTVGLLRPAVNASAIFSRSGGRCNSHNTDFTVLANHCERFAQTLLETDDAAEKLARVMEGLLYYRVSFYADTLNADCKRRMDTWQLIR